MTVWNIYRNDLPGQGGSYYERWRRKYYQLKERLVENGWTILGTATGGAFDIAGADLWTAYTAMGYGSWLWIKNVEDVEVVIWWPDQYNQYLRVSFEGFDTGGASATTPPGTTTPPSDLMDPCADGNRGFSGYVDHYQSVLVNETSFLMFGRAGFYRGCGAMCVVKLVDVDPSDPYPYWVFAWGSDSYGSTYTPWSYYRTENYRDNQRGRHPAGTVYKYSIAKYECPVSPMTNMPLDPVTGEAVMHNVWICSSESQHIRGKVPDVYRVSVLLGDNTHLKDDAFVVCDDYCFPWESTDAMWT